MTDDKDETPISPDVHFEPIIKLPEIDTKTLEEDEEELLKLRARLYRYASAEKPPEWKERGTGDVKLLKHREKGTIRLLMRRDKTLKICANHYITPWMELKPNCGSDRAWVWSVAADFADEEPKEEMLAIKFGNVENAKLFKDKFDECTKIVLENEGDSSDNSDSENETDEVKVLKKLDQLNVNEDEQENESSPVADSKKDVTEAKSQDSETPHKTHSSEKTTASSDQ